MIVVTGGAGFIGSNIVAALAARHPGKIIISDRLRTGCKWLNIAKHEIGGLVSPDELFELLEEDRGRIEAIVHMGAISSTTETDADLIADTNFKLSMRLWRWCAEHQVRFIYASSAATYGDGSHGFSDDHTPEALARFHPLNAYGWSKHVFDRWAVRMAGGDGAPMWQDGNRRDRSDRAGKGAGRPPQWVGLKFFNVYGPNEYHKHDMQSIVAKNFPKVAVGDAVQLFKSHHPDYQDGGQLRDFVYVKDCVSIVEWMLENPHINGIFNVGTGAARSFGDLAAALFRATGQSPRIEYVDMPESLRSRYQYFTQADINALRAAGYDRPMTSLEEGVSDYVINYLSQQDPYG